MKKIIRNQYGYWQDARDDDKDIISVNDDIITGFLNTPYYHCEEFNQQEYDDAYLMFRKSEARNYLLSTDYITIQWNDETALGIEHSRSEAEYLEILQKRQEARDIIRL